MHKDFKGEAIYQAEVDVHFPQLTVGQTLEDLQLKPEFLLIDLLESLENNMPRTAGTWLWQCLDCHIQSIPKLAMTLVRLLYPVLLP
jgi:hypothetical protein